MRFGVTNSRTPSPPRRHHRPIGAEQTSCQTSMRPGVAPPISELSAPLQRRNRPRPAGLRVELRGLEPLTPCLPGRYTSSGLVVCRRVERAKDVHPAASVGSCGAVLTLIR